MNMNELFLVLPEIFLVIMANVILLIDVYLKQSQRAITHFLSLASLVVTVFLILYVAQDSSTLLFGGSYITDSLTALLKVFVVILIFSVFVYSRTYLDDRDMFKGEFYVLGIFGVLGMFVMISGYSLLTIYLGLELLSLSLYAMVAMNKKSPEASEAAIKYFVLGAVASGMLLYGMSIIYGVTGSLTITEIGVSFAHSNDHGLAGTIGMVFVLVGLAFKFGAVPFHMWVPDVYEGSPTPVTSYISSAPKLAAFAMLLRLLVDGLGSTQENWIEILSALVVLSILFGNVIAIGQINFKRMLAYSTISHVGFILMGFLNPTSAGHSAALFYTITYALTAIGVFGVIMVLSRKGFESDKLEDLKGLSDKSPWLAFVLLILLLSMAGMPPTVGFYAKLAVVSSAVDAGYLGLSIFAVILSVVGAFYYLRAIKYIYFDKAENMEQVTKVETTPSTAILLGTNAFVVLMLGIYPALLMVLCVKALA
jgi:NADH-quinone oxidoreductase subunit N